MTTLPETQDNSQATSPRLGGRFRVVLEPFGPGVSAVSFERCGLYMPDVSRLSLADAAQAWAKAGFFVLPIKAGSKNAGSLLGAGWPQRSSRDRAVIASWWARWPDAGIAVHTGRSGVVVADIDVDLLPADLGALKSAGVQLSRSNTSSRRGHYIFASTETFVSGKLHNAAGIAVGEIRSGNTVIVVAPSPHAKGGLYRVVAPGEPIPPLRDQVRTFLRCPAKAGSADIEVFKESYNTGTHLERLKSATRRFRNLVAANDLDAASGKNRHDAMLDVLCLALKESRAGAYPACVALDRLERLWLASVEGRPNHDLAEFRAMSRYAVSLAGTDDIDARRQIMARNYGSDTRTAAADVANYYRNKKERQVNRTKLEPAVNGHALVEDDDDFWKQLDDDEMGLTPFGGHWVRRLVPSE